MCNRHAITLVINSSYEQWLGTVQEFLDGIPDDKFCNWATKQYTIKEDYKLGMRLDHHGASTSREPGAGHSTDPKCDIDEQG